MTFQKAGLRGETEFERYLVFMQHCIYVITNLVNNKVYVGQSKNPSQCKW